MALKNFVIKRIRSPSYLDDARLTDFQQKRVKESKRADPDAKLLEHRGVTVSELATELDGPGEYKQYKM